VGDDVFDQWDEARVRSIYPSLIMKHELVKQRAVYSQSVCSWNKPDAHDRKSFQWLCLTHPQQGCLLLLRRLYANLFTFNMHIFIQAAAVYAPFAISSGSFLFIL
jgi:hypothetical protein